MSSLVSFQPSASTGHSPSEHDMTEIAATSRCCFPSCDWQPDRCNRHKACFFCTHPRLAVPKTCSSNNQLGRPSRTPVLLRFRRIGISARAASLQGFLPSAGWGSPPPDFSTCGTLALLGFILSGAFPFRALASSATVILTKHGDSACQYSIAYSYRRPLPTTRSASSRHFGGYPSWGLVPMLQSVKELRSWLASPEAAGP
jgi:hypothetical protein